MSHDSSPTQDRHRRRLGAAVAAFAGLAMMTGMAVEAAPATATISATYRVVGTAGTGVSARTSPTVAPGGGYGAPEDAEFGVQCQTLGEPFGPRGNTLYFLAEYSGRVFYVPDTYTSSPHLAGQPPIAGIPMCGDATAPVQGSTPDLQGSSPCLQGGCPAPPAPATSTPVSQAVAWARNQIGQAFAAPDDAAAYSDWADGPYGEWSGDCVKFVHRAYAVAGVAIPTGDASDVYRAYESQGAVNNTETPPEGALVFYDVAPPFGHIALSVGGDQVIGTRGLDGDGLAVQQYPVTAISGYLGWAMPV